MGEGEKEPKPGIKSSEFWVMAIASANTMLQTVQGNIPSPWGEIIVAVLGAVYTISRAWTKRK